MAVGDGMTLQLAWALISVSNWYMFKYGWERRFGLMEPLDRLLFGIVSLCGPVGVPSAIWVYMFNEERELT